jgi:hypothetical protein
MSGMNDDSLDCEDDICALPQVSSNVQPELELMSEDPEELLALFEANGWGDGLPLVAPTEERVEAMLAVGGGPATAPPDEIIATLPPRFGQATRRLLAVNAVLAGCPNGVLPVITSAVRALTHPQINLRGVIATTHPVAPLLIVHGKAVDDLGFNSGQGTFGPGCRANASVGRAIRLILLHIAGSATGTGDASTQGQPSKYSYCIAENTEQTPWESYPERCGVSADSAITVACGENPHNFHDMETDRPELILEKAASVMMTLGSNNGPVSSAEFFVVFGPEHAATIAAAGWSCEDIQNFIFETARARASVFRRHFQVTQYADWIKQLHDDDLMPITDDPQNIRILVAGGPGKHSCVIPSWGMTKSVTLPVMA